MAAVAPILRFETITNESLVRRILAGDTALFEIIMRRHNQRLYRIALAILRDDNEAEDVMQDAYVRAFENLHQFAGRASFSTWLSRIVVYEAFARIRKRKRVVELETIPRYEQETMHSLRSQGPSPEEEASHSEVRRLLEQEVSELPENYRIVFVLRDVEELDVAEVAAILNISAENVKTRLHRAHVLLRKRLCQHAGPQAHEVFAFHARRCDRVVKNVASRLGLRFTDAQRTDS